MDVGVTYAAARLPSELYSQSPTMDFTGASFVKNWIVGDNELYLDGYWGNADMPWRHYSRDTATPSWSPLKNKAKGLLLTFHQDENVYRAGLHTADIWNAEGNGLTVNLVSNPPPPHSGDDWQLLHTFRNNIQNHRAHVQLRCGCRFGAWFPDHG